jgi:L-asparaginase
MTPPRILLLHTGGTFGMELQVEEGNKPGRTRRGPTEYLSALSRRVPELERLAAIDVRVLFNLDSSDLGPEQWRLIATSIVEAWDDFDGFVVVHGTDTMAFTACALAFFLSGLTKPVVLTGSQRPLSELRSDARTNLIDAVELAASGIPEVLVCFDGLVHRGARATKYSNEHLQAFRSPNSGPLGAFGVHFRLSRKRARRPLPRLARTPPLLDTRVGDGVVSLDALPGCSLPARVREAVVASARGIVLRGFGAGNLPMDEVLGWLDLCEAATAAGVPVVMSTQCLAGRVSLDAYENGRAFRDRGVIPGDDMTFEALSLKLMVFLGRAVPFAARHEFFKTPLALETSGEGNQHGG